MARRNALLTLIAPWFALACAQTANLRPLDPVGPALGDDTVALEPGTSLVDVYRLLRAVGVTNLNNPLDSYIESAGDGRGYFALTGDQLPELLVFADGRLWRRLPMAVTHWAYVHGVRFHSAQANSDIAFVVVSRAIRYGEPASLQLVAPEALTARYDLTLLALENEGVRDPLFIGRDLGMTDGVPFKAYFTARHSDGGPWSRGYMLDASGWRVKLEEASPQATAEVERCTCYQKWRDGTVPPSFEETLTDPRQLLR